MCVWMWSTGSELANVAVHKCQCVPHSLWGSPPGLPQCIVLFLPHTIGKFSMEISTLNRTWTKLFLAFIWKMPLCPEAWLAAGALPCKASHHMEQIPISGLSLSASEEESCSSCSRWVSSGRLRTPAQALLQDMCLWPHILALPLLSSVSMTSQALSWLHSLYYITRRWDNTKPVYLHMVQRHLEQ